METEWVLARIQLHRLMQRHPTWSNQRYADELGFSLSWVKKWKRRFREAKERGLAMFLSLSRAPKHHGRKVSERVVEVVLRLRDGLREVYHRRVGPKTILYHLHRDADLKACQEHIPTSTSTIWRILKAGGRIPRRIRYHEPLVRPAPMVEWEFDFGMTKSLVPGGLEFAVAVDRGTSILVDTQVSHGYHAETALLVVARIFLLNGLPQRLRFDRDPRLVGSWRQDGYPSPFVRFLHVLGVEPIICPPRRPQKKPYVERAIRSLKHESLFVHCPPTLPQADVVLADFRAFYNVERPNQALSCGNRPPYEAFPDLPTLPTLPDVVDPDRWIEAYHQRIFRRLVNSGGSVMVDKYRYYIGRAYTGQRVALHLDADQQHFVVQHQGKMIKTLPVKGLVHKRIEFQDYLRGMAEEARSIEQHLRRKQRRRVSE